ncbi:MAG: hypothetical protein K6C97_04765 [Treponema sp.]|nr:hypothetical protein [Treponema sp.]
MKLNNIKKGCLIVIALYIGTAFIFATNHSLKKINNKSWLFNEEDNVYYQLGLSYVSNPKDSNYETMGIFVPGDYFIGKKNSDGTYSVKINKKANINGFTVKNAPFVMPIETPGYSAMNAPSQYSSSVKEFTDAGFIYVWAGARGRDHGAPAGVTDFKAAIRYTRYSKSNLPGNTDNFFTFGMSGGGAQSAILGASGDSPLYEDYLKEIGAVMSESDAILGSMDWCPITNLDIANEAYEWNMGASRKNLSEFEQDLSDGLAKEFALYINKLGLKDDEGQVLSLEESDQGIYQAGSYYEWTKEIVENSLNRFLEYTSFPYDASNANQRGQTPGGPGPGAGGPGERPEGMPPMGGQTPPDLPPEMANKGGQTPNNYEAMDNISRKAASGTISLNGTYESAQDYIDALNSAGKWVDYDAQTNTVKITSLAEFSKALKVASKSVGAFDDLNASQGENTLFSYNDGKGAHFDSIMAKLLEGSEYEEDYKKDLERTDSVGNKVQTRINMYNPMYYICDYYEGCGSSKVAKYWRIRSGIFQGDTAVNTEANLAQALKNYGADVDFAAVWGLQHTKAEETGNSDTNFIAWVEGIVKEL